ncbi:unnamed protein product, partial [Effrenium voratum]
GKGPRVRSAFAAACELGDLQAVRAMLRRRPAVAWEPDELGVTPLMFAAAGGAIEVCEALLSAQAALDTCNPLGWTALTWAALRGHAQCCRWLMERKAPLKDNDLIVLAFTGNWQTFEVLLGFASEERRLEVRDHCEKGLLHFALTGLAYMKRTARDHVRCVDLALQAKCEPFQEDCRALRAREGGNMEAVPVLSHFVRCMGESWAASGLDKSGEHLAMVERLCLLRADVGASGPRGSALQLAAEQNFPKVRQALLGARRESAWTLRRLCWCCS